MTMPTSVGQRVDQLNQTHGWMPADMQTTLASSQTSDGEMQTIADHIQNTLSSAWNGFTEAFHDPVLDKQPSGELALTRYLTSAVGPLPVAQVDLTKIQGGLQKAGFGKGLTTNGVWDSDWNAAYNDWSGALRSSQLAGNRPGSVGTAKAAHHWYDALQPSHVVNAVGGFFESLPDDARHLAGDLAGAVIGPAKALLTDPAHPGRHVAEVTAATRSALGEQGVTAQSVLAENRNLSGPVQDLSTVLTLLPLVGQASKAALVARGAFEGEVSREAAQRGPGVIAHSLFGGRTAAEIAANDTRRGLLNTRVFQNIPILKQAGPVVGSLADETGLYYRARTLLAKPYMLPSVRAAGDIGQRGMLTGGAILAANQAEQALGVGSPETQTVLKAKPLDTIDLSLQRITGTRFAHPFSRAIDSLGFILHGPLGSQALPEAIGDRVQALNDAYSDVLGRVGLQGIWERAVSKATDTKVTIDDLHKAFGDEQYFNRFVQLKLADLAAQHYAQHEAQLQGLSYGGSDPAAYRRALGDLHDEVWADPEKHVEAIRQLIAHDAGVGLENRVTADMVHNNLDPKKIADPAAVDHVQKPTVDGYVANAKAWMQAGDHLTQTLRSGLGHYMFGGDGAALIRDSRQAEALFKGENVGSGEWLRANLQHENGALGLGRVTTKSTQQATADIGRFRAALDAAETPEETASIVEKMKTYGFREFGMDARTLGIHDTTPTRLADALDERAHDLASDVFLTYDAPQELHDAVAKMRELGFKPMLGSHIGHVWDGSLPPMPEIDGAVSWKRRIASAIGVAPEQISSRTAGQDASIRVLREIGKALQDPRATPAARTTAETYVAVLRDEGLLQPDMKLLERVAVAASKPFHQRGIEQLARDRGITDMAQARQEYESEMARALQLRDIPRKQMVKVLTTPATGKTRGGADWEWQGVNETTANLIHQAVLRGYSDRPGYIMGAGALEDWARGGFGILGKAATTFPASEMAQRVANLPNQLVIARNRLRFTLSPFFDFRRVAKQNYKMSLDGVTPVMNPLAHMVNNNTFTPAHKYLTKLIGDPAIEGFDDADRYMHQQSVWGLYNSRHFEAYYAWAKKAQGATDDEIRQGITRVFDYGSARQGGRSALERTVNSVFFPFSFEKTLLRNTGAYMLSHPQQALLLTGAMTAYDEANKHEQIHQWVQDHLPVLRDLEKLNAFTHGLSPGELGGINAPLLNLFMPQTWGKEFTKKNLQRNLPIWKDFGQVLTDTLAQARIGKNAALNSADYAIHLGAPRGALNPYRPTVTPLAQQRDASRMRNHAILAWSNVLDYNARQADDSTKVAFPNDPRLPTSVRGHVVNRTTIGQLVRIWYPAYNPGAAQTYAVKQADAAQKYVDNIKDPARKRDYGVFMKLADQVQGHLQRGDYDTATAAQVMTNFRQAAVAASEQDGSFLKFYNDHYRWLLGPIEEVR